MQSPFLTSLILSVILTPVFNSISFLINPRWQKVMTFVASLLATVSSVILLVLILKTPELSEKSFVLFNWIAIAGESPLKLSVEFQVSLLANLFLIFSNGLFTLLVLFQLKPLADPESPNSVLFYSVWAVGFSNLFLISNNLFFCFAFLEFASLMIFLAGNLSGKTSINALHNRRLFLHIHFFNLMILVAFFFIQIHFQSFRISEILSQQERIALLQVESPSVLFVISFLLLVSVAGRCGQFPFLGWTEHVSRQKNWVASLIQTITLVPISFYFLFRFTPILTASPEACFLISLSGALTILLVSLVSIFQESSSVSLGYLIAGNWGLIFAGMSLPERMWGNLILFLLSSLPVVALIIFIQERVNQSNEKNTQQFISNEAGIDTRAGKIGLLISVVYLFTGLSTLSILVEPFSHALFNSGDLLADNLLEWNLYGLTAKQLLSAQYILLLAGHFCLSLAGFRLFFRLIVSMNTASNSYEKQNGFLCIGSFFLLSLAVWLTGYFLIEKVPGFVFSNKHPIQMSLPFQAGLVQIVSAMGAASAWAMFFKKETDSQTVSIKRGAFSRMCRNRFYLEDFIFLGILLPVRGIGQLCRFFDWLVIDGLLVTLPSQVIKKIAWFYDPLDSAEMPFPLISTLSALVVMFITLCWIWVSYY